MLANIMFSCIIIVLGIVRREIPFGELEKSTKRSIYKIIDPFFRFWFKVVVPNGI